MDLERAIFQARDLVAAVEDLVAKDERVRPTLRNFITEKARRFILVRFPDRLAASSYIESGGKTTSFNITTHDLDDVEDLGVPSLAIGDVALGVYIDVDGAERPIGRCCVYGTN